MLSKFQYLVSIFSRLVIAGSTFLVSPMHVFSQGGSSAGSPKREVRAVWITTVNGLDWPKSALPEEQRQALLEMVEALSGAHFNTIFFQVRGRGDAMYRSHFEPWSQLLTGTLGKDPGWDPLRFLLDEAHRRNMEVHAWFNTFLIRSSKLETPETTPRHIVLRHPEWLKNIDGEYWLDPGIPAVRKYLEEVAFDLVSNYDLDGIQFDFIRYPAKPFPDESTFKKFGGKLSKDNWRRENITAFVREAYSRIHSLKKLVKVGSAPIGIYLNFGRVRGLQSYSDLYQDSRRWLKEGIHDYLVPQVYWSLGEQPGDPDFSVVAKEWAGQRFQRHLYLGIGAYKPDVHRQLPELVDIARSLRVNGLSFFRYENISDILSMGGKYATPANIPPMPWIDSLPPAPPENLRVAYDENGAGGGVFTLNWNRNDSGGVAYYNVYRSARKPLDTENPENLLAIVRSDVGSLTDTIRHPVSAKYYYAVSAFNRGNNESAPSPAQSIIMPDVLALAREHMLKNSLGECFRQPSSALVFFPYELGVSTPVFIKILDKSNSEVASVVDAIQDPGNYIAVADLSSLPKGEYTYMLIAGTYTDKKLFRVDR